MDYILILKAGFTGFALCLGVQMLVFYVAGNFLSVTRKSFIRVFVLAGIASFVAVYFLLQHRIATDKLQPAEAMFYLAGCVGGWLGGIFSGLTQVKRFFLGFLK